MDRRRDRGEEMSAPKSPKSSKSPKKEQGKSESNDRKVGAASAELKQEGPRWAAETERGGLRAVIQQYKRLRDLKSEFAQPCSAWEANKKHNRYPDVRCFDSTRVELKEWDRNYIHASYVDGFAVNREFICAQGPLGNQVSDFWHMMWEEKSCVVVMLCQPMEKKRQKCTPYWPILRNNPTPFGPYWVTVKGSTKTTYGDHKITQMELVVKKTKTERKVVHFLHGSWPDRSCPRSGIEFMDFLDKVMETQQTTSKANGFDAAKCPIVVHCSAGIGRTGTFVAVCNARAELLKKGRVEVETVVKKIRNQRAMAVQNEEQYLFIIVCLLDELARLKVCKTDTKKLWKSYAAIEALATKPADR